MRRRATLCPSPWALAISLCAALGLANAAPPEDGSRLDWWREARFGMFIHWGPVSLKGTEIGWSRGKQVPEEEYDQLYTRFNPDKFDASAWARTARRAGMKYIVLTSKHHDGFSLFDSKVTEYDIMSTPFGRDVIEELAAACKREGIVFAAYYSICDWHHPDYPLGSPGGKSKKPAPNMDRYVTFLKAQLKELLTRYGRLGILWFDGQWESPWSQERGRDLYDYVRGLQPSIIVNNRVGKGRAGAKGTTRAGANPGDYDTPEQRVGKFQNDRPWESCITICKQWAWKPNDRLKSLRQCIQTLVSCAGGDGNLLLNVGPMPTGEIEPRQVARLEEMGDWLGKYGESIYGTRGGPFKPGTWGASTHRGKTVYVHVFQWGEDGLRLPALGVKIREARALTGGPVEIGEEGAGLRLRVPPAHRQDIDTVLRLELEGEAGEIPPVAVEEP